MADPIKRGDRGRDYFIGAVVAVLTSFLTVWTTIVRDDGTGMNYFLIVMAAVVGSFAAWFEAAGLARTMLGTSIMQVLLAVAIATAPITANTPAGPTKALLFGGFFAALWLLSAAFFRAAANSARSATAAGAASQEAPPK
jgi:hypothetical protein